MRDLVTVGSSAAEDSPRTLCRRLVCQACIYYVHCIEASISDCAAAKPIGGFIRAVILVTYKIMKAKWVTFDYNLHCFLSVLHFKVTCTQGTGLNWKRWSCTMPFSMSFYHSSSSFKPALQHWLSFKLSISVGVKKATGFLLHPALNGK